MRRHPLPQPTRPLPSPGPVAGFSLVELLIVLAVVGLLAGLLLPAVQRATAVARGTACIGHLHQIGLALQMYTGEHHQRLPVLYDKRPSTNPVEILRQTQTVEWVLGPFLGNTNVLRCPADREGFFETTGSSFSWNTLLNGQPAYQLRVMGLPFAPHEIPIFFDKEGFHHARGQKKAVNYLYADGHIGNLLTLEGPARRP